MSWRPLKPLADWVDRRHGTWRGGVRSLLARLELASGRLRPFQLRHPHRVRRVVFVCLGNICRSAFAHQVAARLEMEVASLGLSTSTGAGSPDSALRAASRHGYDMAAHRATDLSDFEVRPGDLLLVMEVRQARELRRRLGARDDVEVALLGLWCAPPMPHLHDPFTLSDAYFDQCFSRVRDAVRALHRALPQVSRRTAGAGR
ncbi:hypothetical protein [Duganella sp. P38]|uniref:arsenate reductase/protein-tyrosine-phosphatase family protein n=1 Tax=Duganella sp. P38 TaxID=3423949 RepID=UPI003D7A406D